MTVQHALQLLSLNLKVRYKNWNPEIYITIKDNLIVDHKNDEQDWNELAKAYPKDDWEVFHD